MKDFQVSKWANFFLVGIDHRKAPVAIREQFSLNQQEVSHLIYDYKQEAGKGIMVLSTCNRTEIYGFGDCPRHLISLFCKHSGNATDLFYQYQNVLQNREAIRHLFSVGAGMQSKILGDFEIIGQIKKAYQFSKEQGAHNAFLDRLVNNAAQCSKKVKNETALSSGAASVAFAAVMQSKAYLKTKPKPEVLVYGMGKIGRTTVENLVNQTQLQSISLVNRTDEKAQALAEKLHLNFVDLAHLEQALDRADLIIVATGAPTPTVKASAFQSNKKRLILDLSMPRNVEQAVYASENNTVIDVDHLSDIATESIQKRASELPRAEALVEEKVEAFYDWLETRRVAPTLQALRAKMDHWKQREIEGLQKKFPEIPAEQAEELANSILNRITGQLARQLKSGNDLTGDLRTIHHIFELNH